MKIIQKRVRLIITRFIICRGIS